MSDSLVFYHDRNDNLQIIDPDAVPHADEPNSLIQIAAAVMRAGYAGVMIDETQLSNGRFIHYLSVNTKTPEGIVMKRLGNDFDLGRSIPSESDVLSLIADAYASQPKF